MQLGDIHIDRIKEMEIPFMTPAAMFPDAPVEAGHAESVDGAFTFRFLN